MDGFPGLPQEWPYHAVVGSPDKVREAQIWCTDNLPWPRMSYFPHGLAEGACFCFVERASAQALVARFGGRILTMEERERIAEEDEEIEEAEQAHFDEYVLCRAPEGFWKH